MRALGVLMTVLRGDMQQRLLEEGIVHTVVGSAANSADANEDVGSFDIARTVSLDVYIRYLCAELLSLSSQH